MSSSISGNRTRESGSSEINQPRDAGSVGVQDRLREDSALHSGSLDLNPGGMDDNSGSSTEGGRPSRALPICRVKETLKRRGYEWLDAEQYKGGHSVIRVQHLVCGTVFSVQRDRLAHKASNPCPACNKRKIRTEEEARIWAEARGGKLILWAPKNHEPSTWECQEGHRWQQRFSPMRLQGYWCLKCSHKHRFTRSNDADLSRLAKKQLASYLRRDRSMGRENNLDLESVIEARTSKCIYCGRAAIGLDRIDNEIGHTKINCVPACLRCNWMRGRYITHKVMLQVGKLLEEIDP